MAKKGIDELHQEFNSLAQKGLKLDFEGLGSAYTSTLSDVQKLRIMERALSLDSSYQPF